MTTLSSWTAPKWFVDSARLPCLMIGTQWDFEFAVAEKGRHIIVHLQFSMTIPTSLLRPFYLTV